MKLLIFLAITLAYSCSNSKKSLESVHKNISIKKHGCRGNCEQYTMSIADSGNLFFEGIRNVEKIGIYNSKIEPEELELLNGRFIENEFNSLDSLFLTPIKTFQ